MTKVVYSVVKEGRKGSSKMTGLGYLTEKDLIIACISKNSKPYIRVFEDCVKNCHLVHNTKNLKMKALNLTESTKNYLFKTLTVYLLLPLIGITLIRKNYLNCLKNLAF